MISKWRNRRGKGLAMGLGVAAFAALCAAPGEAQALPLLTLSGSARALYGAALGDPPVSGYGLGLGLRAGVTLPASVYLGGSFDYFFGETQDLELPGSPPVEVSSSLLQVMGHAGYDLGLGPLTLRPGLGLGLASASSESLGVDSSESDLVISPGAEAIVGLGFWSVSAEVRYNKIFADGDVDALVLGAGVGFSL